MQENKTKAAPLR